MRITIDPDSRIPASEQLAGALRARIGRGTLAPGERVPPVRELALQLSLAANTVAKAYRRLESEGLLVGRGRSGTFVAARPGGEGAQLVGAAADEYLRRARGLGATPEEMLEAVRARLPRR